MAQPSLAGSLPRLPNYAVMDVYAGNRRSRLQALLDDLGFERFGVRASLAHENPGDKGDRVRKRGHHRPLCWSSVGIVRHPLTLEESELPTVVL